ncbi:MAG: class I SAM-dependent methyltransferase [Melioribacteraceae bacterium]|nr:class I SAM-dependent methyltransferase [Melioribacteraceae bacterium]WKZ69241.1 MAG: class I SAM-dependent methyltransferase [Melioribacteraceae bacterium]
MSKEFYRNAKAYDVAFLDREFDKECDFLEWCFNNYSKVKKSNKQNRFVELGCGPARHAREFAKRNWKSIALDLSDEMIEYARHEAKKDNLDLTGIVANMIDFKLDKKVPLAATLMESIAHITRNEDMVEHFKSVAANLKKGGLYIIEATHPQFYFPDDEPNTWISKEGNFSVEITFGDPNDSYNSLNQTWLSTTRLKIKNGNAPQVITESRSEVRWYLLQEMKLLIEKAGVFDKAWFFGSLYSIPPKPLDESEDSDAMVIVLRKAKDKVKKIEFNI